MDVCIVESCGDLLNSDHSVFDPGSDAMVQSVDMRSPLVEDWIVRQIDRRFIVGVKD